MKILQQRDVALNEVWQYNNSQLDAELINDLDIDPGLFCRPNDDIEVISDDDYEDDDVIMHTDTQSKLQHIAFDPVTHVPGGLVLDEDEQMASENEPTKIFKTTKVLKSIVKEPIKMSDNGVPQILVASESENSLFSEKSLNELEYYPVIPSYHKDSSEKIKKFNLVLDLDHTLLHSIDKSKLTKDQLSYLKNSNKGRYFDIWFMLSFKGVPREFYQMFILREGVREFLKEANKYWNLFVNTKGRLEYALSILDALDPNNDLHLKDHLKAMTDEDIISGTDKTQK